MSAAAKISTNYVDLVSLSARQAMSGLDITVGSDASDVLVFGRADGAAMRMLVGRVLPRPVPPRARPPRPDDPSPRRPPDIFAMRLGGSPGRRGLKRVRPPEEVAERERKRGRRRGWLCRDADAGVGAAY